MNRILTGSLTPSRARILRRFSEYSGIEIPKEIAEEADKDILVPTGKYAMTPSTIDRAQFIVDMNLRCSVVNRKIPFFETAISIVAALQHTNHRKIFFYGLDEHKSIFSNNDIEICKLPSHPMEMIAVRKHPVVIDIDSGHLAPHCCYQVFPKVIIYGYAIKQYLLFKENLKITDYLYPAITNSAKTGLTKHKIKTRRLLSGNYPED